MSAALDSGSFEIDLEPESSSGVSALSIGALVAERYRLEAVIGRGGVATVWHAHDVVLDRAVALKVLSPCNDPEEERSSYDRFLREARICAAIRHPNVVHLLDFGSCAGRAFLVMELLEGEPLDQKLEREVQLGVDDAIAIAVGILDGLDAAHAAGVVHRDLKPANVFIVRQAGVLVPKLVDFGISRSVDRSRRSALTTAEGQIFGTPAYMSPEQARGSRALDRRTDLYSAAVIVYECLAGVLPYESEALGDLIVEIVTREPPPLSRIRPDVGPISDVLARAMSHRAEHRFASAREMREALVGACEDVRRDRSAPTIPVRTAPRHEEDRTVVDVPSLRAARTPRRIDVQLVAGGRAPSERSHRRASVIVGSVLVLAGAAFAIVHVVTARELPLPPIVPGALVSEPPPQEDEPPAHAPARPAQAEAPPGLDPPEEIALALEEEPPPEPDTIAPEEDAPPEPDAITNDAEPEPRPRGRPRTRRRTGEAPELFRELDY